MIEFHVTYKALDDRPGRGWMQSHTDTFPTELRAKNRANEVMTKDAEDVAVWKIERTRIA